MTTRCEYCAHEVKEEDIVLVFLGSEKISCCRYCQTEAKLELNRKKREEQEVEE